MTVALLAPTSQEDLVQTVLVTEEVRSITTATVLLVSVLARMDISVSTKIYHLILFVFPQQIMISTFRLFQVIFKTSRSR